MFHTIGRKRPTTSCKRPVIWPNEQTWAASSRAGKTFLPRSATAASSSNARFAFSAFFFLNLRSRSTCNCCFARGVRASFTSGASSSPSRYLFNPMIPFFHRGEHAPKPFDLAELFQDRRFHCALDRFHAGRTAQHVHRVFENAGLLQQDRLPVRGEPDPFFARRCERFIRAVGMTRVRGVHVGQNQFRGRSGEIVFEFGGD